MTHIHILLGRKSDGATVYYTGRAGSAFVSDDRSEAFPYDTLHAARRRAMNLNRMSAIHGIRFIAPCADDEPRWSDSQRELAQD